MSQATAHTPKWYVLRTFTGHESKVKAALEYEMKRMPYLQDKILNITIPQETVFEVRNGKRRQRIKNFLPGYIILEVVLDKRVKDVIGSLNGVVGFLGANAQSEPQPLRAEEVAHILGRVEERKDVATIEHTFQVGDPIKVIEGPFSNFTGQVREVNNEKQKLKVEVGILGRRTPVELDFDQVEIERPQ
ncbi:MAG: transcription termination/antitermination protein NusG [Candidatus Kapaibacterium sp.]